MKSRDRIIIDPDILAGKPILKGTRISVEFLPELLSNGWSHEAILENYPQIRSDDILAALRYATALLKDEHVYPLPQKVRA